MIDEIKGNLQDAIQELRALAHGIFPPLLVSGGLAEALPAAADAGRAADDGRHRRASAATRADMEAAVYFCVLEALQNAGKHAGDGATVARDESPRPTARSAFEVSRRRRRVRRRRRRRRRPRLRQHGRPPRRLRRAR